MIYVAPEFRHLVLGDILTVRREGYYHQGLVWGFNDRGLPVVASIAENRGFYLESFGAFLGRRDHYWCDYPSDIPSDVVLRRALLAAERTYHWRDWNCQHFVRAAHELPPQSPDAESASNFFGLVAGLAMTAVLVGAFKRT